MHSTYTHPRYGFRRPPELDSRSPARHPVVVVGAGPVGLCAAIDLAQRGLPVVLIDEDDTVSVGSRGLCYAKRTLEVLDRLGVGQAVVDRGVTWNVGRTFFDADEVFRFNLQPEPGHQRPGMVNLQQYHLEEILVRRAQALPTLDLRWKSRVAAVQAEGEGVQLEVATPEGSYRLQADWLVVADGARSPLRRMLGLEAEGRVFQDRFLIADVVMEADFPAERWFWFDPPFHRSAARLGDSRAPASTSVLLHREADNVWRIDFQLGWDADPEEEKKSERVIPRIQAMLGPDRPFKLEWVSVYTFQCRRMARFRHGRVLFTGDAAHQVSPFGARGANSGIQDVDNLGWKLHAVLQGRAPEQLLDSYSDERVAAADENILNSTRATDFITPKSAVSRAFRDAVLDLAADHAFARSLVNSGRLSVPTHLAQSPLNTADSPDADFSGWMAPGAPIDDAPVAIGGQPGWLLDIWATPDEGQTVFTLLVFGSAALDPAVQALLDASAPVGLRLLRVAAPGDATVPADGGLLLHDTDGLLARRYDGRPGTTYLIRPDQHVAARWRQADASAVRAAIGRALALH